MLPSRPLPPGKCDVPKAVKSCRPAAAPKASIDKSSPAAAPGASVPMPLAAPAPPPQQQLDARPLPVGAPLCPRHLDPRIAVDNFRAKYEELRTTFERAESRYRDIVDSTKHQLLMAIGENVKVKEELLKVRADLLDTKDEVRLLKDSVGKETTGLQGGMETMQLQIATMKLSQQDRNHNKGETVPRVPLPPPGPPPSMQHGSREAKSWRTSPYPVDHTEHGTPIRGWVN